MPIGFIVGRFIFSFFFSLFSLSFLSWFLPVSSLYLFSCFDFCSWLVPFYYRVERKLHNLDYCFNSKCNCNRKKQFQFGSCVTLLCESYLPYHGAVRVASGNKFESPSCRYGRGASAPHRGKPHPEQANWQMYGGASESEADLLESGTHRRSI